MGLAFYDSDKNPFGDSGILRSFHDGHLGSIMERIIYLRNDDSSRYYTNLLLRYTVSSYQDFGEFGTTGWGIKFINGERRPTESEWDLVRSGESLSIPDIGSTEAADTHTYYPIWVRITCPGGEVAQLRENQQIELDVLTRLVGA